MKIKTKLWLGLSSKPFIIILLIVSGIIQVTGLNKLSTDTQSNYELSLLAEQIHIGVKDEAISLRNLVIMNDSDSIQREIAILNAESQIINDNLAKLEGKVKIAEQRNRIEALRNTNEKFNAYKERVVELIVNGDVAEAVALIDSNGHSIHDELLQVISSISAEFEENRSLSFTTTTEEYKNVLVISGLICLAAIIASSSFVFSTVLGFGRRLSHVSNVMRNIAAGKADLSEKVEVTSNDEIDDVARSFNTMVMTLEEQRKKESDLVWTKSHIAEITTALSGIHHLGELAQTFLSKTATLLEAAQAAFYGIEIDAPKEYGSFQLLASYAVHDGLPERFKMGEGLIGQAALEKSPIHVSDVPSDYIRIQSALGDVRPFQLHILPVLFEGEVKGVLEFACLKPLTAPQQSFLEEVTDSLGIILESEIGRIQLAKLLEETQLLMEEVQAQSEELQSQQEELRVTNEELEEQTQALRHSELVLQRQQEELEEANKELHEKAEILEKQNKMFELTNIEVEKARAELEEKADQLALSSKYKSEFLANMSHELRTPLNSLLILSRLLADNMEGTLTEKQVKFAKTIYSSGSDLLLLINDILDLAKIESGKMELNRTKVRIGDIAEFAENNFRPIANERGLSFNISLMDNLPDTIYSDELRLQQILKNLLSNAFKFTEQGEVSLEIGFSARSGRQGRFSFSVADTGIGIPKDKQSLIFEAFQQADGTTSRRYGGTGLGLSIVREISNLLKGEIVVESEEGRGSRFTFYAADLPEEEMEHDWAIAAMEAAVSKEIEESVPEVESVIPNQENKGLKGSFKSEEASSVKRLLIVDHDPQQRNTLMELIGEKNVIIKAVSTGGEAIEELRFNKVDYIVLDLSLTDMNGFDLLEKIKMMDGGENVHAFIHTRRGLTSKEEILLKKYTNTIIMKDEQSQRRLMDELELHLNSEANILTENDHIDASPPVIQSELEGKKVLLVDDDVRNVYALMSFLEQYHMEITFAENGRESIEELEKNPKIDLILMDIMMPEMDGFEAIRRIRGNPEFSSIPIIALTAKAMKEDREKCMEAGANDYIVKPFDPNQLLSLLRVWLYKEKR